jgi:hypothetical protein
LILKKMERDQQRVFVLDGLPGQAGNDSFAKLTPPSVTVTACLLKHELLRLHASKILRPRPRQNNPTGKSPKVCKAPLGKNILIFRNNKSVHIRTRLTR